MGMEAYPTGNGRRNEHILPRSVWARFTAVRPVKCTFSAIRQTPRRDGVAFACWPHERLRGICTQDEAPRKRRGL